MSSSRECPLSLVATASLLTWKLHIQHLSPLNSLSRPSFYICVCFCWSQTARGIVSCGFGDQDCKLLNFQIKPYDFNHCKPSKKMSAFILSLLLHNLGSVHSIETMRHKSGWYTQHMFCTFILLPSPVFDLNWCLLDRRGGSRWLLPHPSQPLWFSLTTLSGPAGEYLTTKAAI